MSPEEALQRQIERYRQMTPGERVQVALRLHRLACEVSREGIRAQFPDFDEAAVERELRRRIQLGRECNKYAKRVQASR